MNTIYVFSGLGADERVFQNIDFRNAQVHHVKWIIPENNETIASYAKRIGNQVSFSNSIFVGLSFGGMMAIEVAKQIPVEKIILISSAKTKYEIPWYYRFAGKLRLHKLIPISLFRSANSLTYWFFGTKGKEEKRLLRIILKETDAVYLKWAVDQVVNWKNLELPKHSYHIHGNSDHVLPNYSQADKIIEGGGHFMLMNKAHEINPVLMEQL